MFTSIIFKFRPKYIFEVVDKLKKIFRKDRYQSLSPVAGTILAPPLDATLSRRNFRDCAFLHFQVKIDFVVEKNTKR